MDALILLITFICFIAAFIGIIYPIIPTVIFVGLAYVIYGLYFGFQALSVTFWVIQIILILSLLAADFISNLVTIKKFGGSNAAIWGSTIGLVFGPFVIPVAGLFLGAIIGAILAELVVHRRPLGPAVKIGIGSLVGFLGGAFLKGLLLVVSMLYFIFAHFVS
ncbi:DUF456 domain-containing protein [Desertibacillus haloalkaliphilus]|uniref:DUF456 domain-containing protein n=1 Tax=Desertibacillus haloalkaliphilus TaxID=1328930 RepID=UPI001C254AB8|nr:DUF456 family protein [Desertibacillus haloalkaliphilus]MBU8905711.1 DUF456 family protein [Desertibacillus haloalkaliphilus]